MSTALRIVLIAGAMGTMVYFLRQSRKNRLQIVYAISWSLFSIVLVALSLFPQILSFFANLLGVVSPHKPCYIWSSSSFSFSSNLAPQSSCHEWTVRSPSRRRRWRSRKPGVRQTIPRTVKARQMDHRKV